MKILMVLDANDGRGMFRHGYILAHELARKGHRVAIAYIDQKEGVTEEDGLKVYKFAGYLQHAAFLYAQSDIRHHVPMPDGLAIKKLSKIIDKEKPDLVHVHGWVLYSVASLRRTAGIPVVTTLHDYGYFCPTKLLLKNNLELCNGGTLKECLKCSYVYYGPAKGLMTCIGVFKYGRLLRSKTDLFIAVSSHVQQRYIAAGFPEDKITVIPNFYSPTEKSSANNAPELPLTTGFILYVGELSNAKGVNLLINAYQKLQTDVKLVLIGRRQAGFNFRMNENIIVLEDQPHDVVMNAWSQCLFGVIPSILAEPCPTVAFEAMAFGKAIVASAVGGLKDIVVHEETGLLVKPGDEGALAEALQRLLVNPVSDLMGQYGRIRLEKNFLSSSVVREIENKYFDFVNNVNSNHD
jgi:glycosyltransferase involved in cell wall biosynthesis